VREVLLQEVEKPANGSLVLLMTLTFDDDLLRPPNPLIPTILRKVLLGEELFAPGIVLCGQILVFFGDTALLGL
jgi:hypothetical protein